MFRFFYLLCLASLLITSCDGYSLKNFPETNPECTTDNNCKSGFTCKNGTCIQIEEKTTDGDTKAHECYTDEDCAPGLTCIFNSCNLPTDSSDGDLDSTDKDKQDIDKTTNVDGDLDSKTEISDEKEDDIPPVDGDTSENSDTSESIEESDSIVEKDSDSYVPNPTNIDIGTYSDCWTGGSGDSIYTGKVKTGEADIYHAYITDDVGCTLQPGFSIKDYGTNKVDIYAWYICGSNNKRATMKCVKGKSSTTLQECENESCCYSQSTDTMKSLLFTVEGCSTDPFGIGIDSGRVYIKVKGDVIEDFTSYKLIHDIAR